MHVNAELPLTERDPASSPSLLLTKFGLPVCQSQVPCRTSSRTQQAVRRRRGRPRRCPRPWRRGRWWWRGSCTPSMPSRPRGQQVRDYTQLQSHGSVGVGGEGGYGEGRDGWLGERLGSLGRGRGPYILSRPDKSWLTLLCPHPLFLDASGDDKQRPHGVLSREFWTAKRLGVLAIIALLLAGIGVILGMMLPRDVRRYP